jgi:hypothetical protein
LQAHLDTEAVTEMIFAGVIGASVVYGMDKSKESLDHTISTLIGYVESLAP